MLRFTLPFLAAFPLLAVTACGESRERAPAPNPGAACVDVSECTGALACISSDRFPGGYCSAICSDGVCPEGSRCVAGFGTTLCLAACDADADCRDGYQCWAGVCQPRCRSEADCGTAGATCEEGRCSGAECAVDRDCGAGRMCAGGRCLTATDGGPGGDPEGAPCRAATDCASRVCLPPSLGGVCARACSDRDACGGFELSCSPVAVDADGDGAPDGVAAACIEANPAGAFLAGACTAHGDCESRACVRGQCQVVCDGDDDCLPGQVCRDLGYPGVAGTYRGCDYPDRAGALEVRDVDLGSIDVHTGVPTGRINFAVPPDAVSVTLLARRTGGAAMPLSFIDVWDPASESLFDYVELVSWIDQPIRWYPIHSEEQVSMLVPSSTPDRVPFRHGRYGFTVAGLVDGAAATARVALRARVKRSADAELTRGTLGLNVYLVGIGVTAATAPSHTRLQNSLAELGAILGAAGISLGAVQYVDVSSADAATFGVIDSSDGPDSEMARLLRLSEDRTNEAINLFLVRGISEGAGESGGIALGVAGGIPGPPGVHGTMNSGVLVSFDTSVVGSDPRVVAQIAAHEIGHYLGLFHNREGGPACPDGTGPTPSSPCAPFGGTDPIADTSRTDGTNLMWYALGGADGRTYNVRLTPGQGFVVRRNPVVR